MFVREMSTTTLASLSDQLDRPVEALSITGDQIRFDAEANTITVGTREFPYSEESLVSIGNWLDVPSPFARRLDPDLTAYMFNALLHRKPSPVVAYVGESGVQALREPNQKEIEPRRIVDVAAKVMTPDSIVTDWGRDFDFFRFDVVVPEKAKYGIGGDKKVGDLTRGGLRFGHESGKKNLAPWVQPYNYRLVCSNGMEVFDGGLKVDARGSTVEEVMMELEVAAERAFSRVEKDIAHFYDLRSEKVANPERTLNRMAAERGLSNRPRLALIDRLPSIESDEVSMFDLVNLITNAANDPAVTRWGARREFQSFGGQIVTEHVDRCTRCQSKLA